MESSCDATKAISEFDGKDPRDLTSRSTRPSPENLAAVAAGGIVVAAVVAAVATAGRSAIGWGLARPFVFTVKERRVQPCVISYHCRCEAIAIAYEGWAKLSRVPRFGRLLMAAPLEAGDLPKRNRKPVAISATSRDSGVRAHDLFEALPQGF